MNKGHRTKLSLLGICWHQERWSIMIIGKRWVVSTQEKRMMPLIILLSSFFRFFRFEIAHTTPHTYPICSWDSLPNLRPPNIFLVNWPIKKWRLQNILFLRNSKGLASAIWPIYHRCERGRFLVYASCLTISNHDLLSSNGKAGGLILGKKDGKKKTRLIKLDISKPLMIFISQRSEELRL